MEAPNRDLTPNREGLAMKATPRMCPVPDCDRESGARTGKVGMCNAHYLRMLRHGRTGLKPRPVPTECSVPECIKVGNKAGMCGMHYQRMRTHGSTDLRPKRPPQPRASRPVPKRTPIDYKARLDACPIPPDLPGEDWRPVVGWEGLYEVSDLGRVRTIGRVAVCRDGRELGT